MMSLLAFLPACNDSGSSSGTPDDGGTSTTSSGSAVDPYVGDAKVYVCDSTLGNCTQVDTTDYLGSYYVKNSSDNRILIKGGVERRANGTSIGAFTGALIGRIGTDNYITPLTTLATLSSSLEQDLKSLGINDIDVNHMKSSEVQALTKPSALYPLVTVAANHLKAVYQIVNASAAGDSSKDINYIVYKVAGKFAAKLAEKLDGSEEGNLTQLKQDLIDAYNSSDVIQALQTYLDVNNASLNQTYQDMLDKDVLTYIVNQAQNLNASNSDTFDNILTSYVTNASHLNELIENETQDLMETALVSINATALYLINATSNFTAPIPLTYCATMDNNTGKFTNTTVPAYRVNATRDGWNSSVMTVGFKLQPNNYANLTGTKNYTGDLMLSILTDASHIVNDENYGNVTIKLTDLKLSINGSGIVDSTTNSSATRLLVYNGTGDVYPFTNSSCTLLKNASLNGSLEEFDFNTTYDVLTFNLAHIINGNSTLNRTALNLVGWNATAYGNSSNYRFELSASPELHLYFGANATILVNGTTN